MKTLTRTALTILSALTLTSLATAAMPAVTPGAFHALGAPTSGSARIVQKAGKATLELKNFKTEVGPDLQVWLYQAAAPRKGANDVQIAKGKYLKVGELKKFKGEFSFALPAGTRLTDYKSVVIWCQQVMTAFGAADLK
ncbi:DM13 domain-containing protein [Deinococcus koreensis]|uniref:DM13 domain-containing protein n=1 Tax=Deinococcus koreensis TaxID=2054903 RepID=A0A2K3UT73_9DEIO|nr:DM13 domain-containing protein [Deinococcus koreensis]PNY79739.1 hypothetical protein CVO96_17450 [Deinococcus koreensis]